MSMDSDNPRISSCAQTSTLAAGVVVSGSLAKATFVNLNQTVAGLDSKPGAPPTSSNVTAGIVANDRSQVTIFHNYPPGQRSGTSENADNQIEALLKTIHRNTWEKTAVDIRDSFKADKFPEPNFEVHPQIIESPHFYQGGHPVTASPIKERKLEKFKLPEYKKDHRFTFERRNVKGERSLSDKPLMKKICAKKDKLGVLGVVAQAGAGKTTCMRRWARHVMTLSGMSKENKYMPCKESRFQMVHFVDMKGIPTSEITSLQEFLFKDLFENEECGKAAYKWVLEHQNEVALFLDGLDQVQQKITEQDLQTVGPHGQKNCSTILFNLLTRNLLPGVRIIISSREHAAASLPEEAWISDVITLTGFSEDDAKKLFNAVTNICDAENDSVSITVPEDAATTSISSPTDSESSQLVIKSGSSTTIFNETVSVQDHHHSNWDKLTKTSASLLSFISVPVFLMFTAIVFNTFAQTPSSVTELLVKVFETLPFSVVIQKRKTIWTVIYKLKKLSHTGMKKGFVIFSSEDLTDHELSVDDIQDLLLMVPRSRSLSHRLIEGDNVFFFCHQILQEFLSACFIVEMRLEDFKAFVEIHLHENHWSVVRRFICGLIFSVSENFEKLLQISDINEKQDILRQSLADQLPKARHPGIELYAAIYESNDDSVIHLITDIYVSGMPLSSDGAHLIGSLLARCKKLSSLTIIFCDLDNELLSIAAKSIEYPKIQVGKIHLQDNIFNFDFAALNNFLEHIDSNEVQFNGMPRDVREDGQPCQFDWKNVQKVCIPVNEFDTTGSIYSHICFRNMDNSIVLTSDYEGRNSQIHSGIYNKKYKTLTVKLKDNMNYAIRCLAIVVHWLNRCSVLLDIEEKLCMQYFLCEDLTRAADLDITHHIQIENILVNCTDFEANPSIANFEKLRRDVSSVVEKLQVKVMDLAISPWQIQDIRDMLAPLLRLNGFELRVHVVQRCKQFEDLLEHVAMLKGRKIESFQLVVGLGDITTDHLVSWIRNLTEAGVKRLVIAPWVTLQPRMDGHEKLILIAIHGDSSTGNIYSLDISRLVYNNCSLSNAGIWIIGKNDFKPQCELPFAIPVASHVEK